jgi:hypothetical protein
VEEKNRVIIGDDDAGMRSKCHKQAFCCVPFWLNVWIIDYGDMTEFAEVIVHSVDHKAMQAIGSPRIAHAKRFENDKRESELLRPSNGTIQCEIE